MTKNIHIKQYLQLLMSGALNGTSTKKSTKLYGILTLDKSYRHLIPPSNSPASAKTLTDLGISSCNCIVI